MNKIQKTFIGYSSDIKIRIAATSGGVGTSIIKYLFDKNKISSATSFEFDEQVMMYKPKVIYNYSEYSIVGSIYHEIDLIGFVKSNIDIIKSPFLCIALPCQVLSIKKILNENKILSIIISLMCSSQQRYDATIYLFKMLNINIKDIKKFKYRGDGWPGSINIIMKSGKSIVVKNNSSEWSSIFHSKLFIRRKCYICDQTISSESDIVLGDPWLDDIIKKEKIGQSLILCNSEKGYDLIKSMRIHDYVVLDDIENKLLCFSQESTIKRKNKYKKNKILTKVIVSLLENKLYKSIVLSNRRIFKLHCNVLNKIEYYMK